MTVLRKTNNNSFTSDIYQVKRIKDTIVRFIQFNSFFVSLYSFQGLNSYLLLSSEVFAKKMGVIMSCIGKSSKNMCLDDKIERKIVEMRRYKFAQSKLKSVDSIVMMFPMFKERLKTLRGMFEQYGKFQ